MEYYLSVDCGLTRIKAALTDLSGGTVALAAADTGVTGERIDTAAFTAAVFTVIKETLAQCPGAAVRRVSASGHGNGLYALLGSGGSFGVSSMASGGPVQSDELYKLTLQRSWSGQPLNILRTLHAREPALYSDISEIMFCKDFVVYLLTGKTGTDLSDASAAGLLNAATGGYDERILDIHGVADKRGALPVLRKCTDVSAFVSDDAAAATGLKAGTPVCAGLFDVSACILGTGARTGGYNLVAGTWGINSVITGGAVDCPEVTQACMLTSPGDYMLIDSSPVSCVNLEWLLQKVFPELSFAEADALVERTPVSEDPIYFPFIYPPMDMPAAKAGFTGFTPETGRAQLLRAVYEGVVFEHRRRVEKFRRAGFDRDYAVLSGGAAKSGVWCQMFADITGLRIEAAAAAQAGLLGGAVNAAVSDGAYSSFAEAAGAMVRQGAVYEPRHNDVYEAKYLRYKEELKKWITE